MHIRLGHLIFSANCDCWNNSTLQYHSGAALLCTYMGAHWLPMVAKECPIHICMQSMS